MQLQRKKKLFLFSSQNHASRWTVYAKIYLPLSVNECECECVGAHGVLSCIGVPYRLYCCAQYTKYNTHNAVFALRFKKKI